jgi:toxin ParE1/3/4
VKVRLSKAATEDVDDAWDYTAERWSIDQADSLLDRFEEKFRLLSRFPETGRAREGLAPGLRSLASSGFVILYQIHGGVLEIVRIVHGSRDLEGLLAEEGDDASGDTP